MSKYPNNIVLRVYGFEEEPYRLPVFLTKRTFDLEFLRHILHVESELFLKHKKASNMKFKYMMEPFVVISTSSLLIVQAILRSLNFQLDKKTKYDPKHVISQRKAYYKIGNYEYQEDEELATKANHNYT